MDIVFTWDDDAHNTLLCCCSGVWSWQDFAASQPQLLALVDPLPQPFAFMLDLRAITAFAPTKYLTAVRYYVLRPHPAFDGRVVIIGAPVLVKQMSQMARAINPFMYTFFQMRFVDTPEDARLWLANTTPDRRPVLVGG